MEFPPEFDEKYYRDHYDPTIVHTGAPLLDGSPAAVKEKIKAKAKLKGKKAAATLIPAPAFTPYEHYLAWGRRDGQIASPAARRAAFLDIVTRHLGDHPEWTALEIGPYFNPALTGPNVKYMDIMDGPSLRDRAVRMGLNPARVPEEIHYVGTDLTMVPDQSMDLVFSSHNIEHQPDLVSHLQNVQRILKPGTGVFCVICPDWRYCFDRTVGESTLGEVLEAYYDKQPQRKSIHRLANMIDQRIANTHNDPQRHWRERRDMSEEKIEKWEAPGIAERIRQVVEEFQNATGYVDVHGFQYTPQTFRSIVSVLCRMGLIDLQPVRVYDTPYGSHEFTAVLQRVA